MTVKPGWARKRPTAAPRLPSTKQEPRWPLPPGERTIWDLNRDEQRIMMITVVGGLGSVVLGAAIVGAAIALARAIKAAPYETNFALSSVLWVMLIAGGILMRYVFDRYKGRPGSRWQHAPPAVRVALVAYGLLASVFALALIGLAAGIK